MNKMHAKMWTGILIAFYLVFGAAFSDAAVRQGPVNRVVVVVDCSGSFKARRMEAIQATTNLLKSMGETKLHRWETGNSEVALIALDAMPEVIWKGDLKKLQKTDRKEWTDRFNARKDLTGCTDVKGALELAAAELQGDPSLVSKYLFVFSDLVHEPPTTSVSRCEKALYGPSPDLPWGAFEDVSVSVFWVPANIKLTWDRAVKEQGLQAFKLFSTSQSDAEKISPPPKPVRVVTEEERGESRAALINLGTGVITWAGYLLAGFVALTILMAAGAKFRRRFATARPARPRPRPLPLSSTPRPGTPRPLTPRPFGPPSGLPRPRTR
jgi:hypothetical protein